MSLFKGKLDAANLFTAQDDVRGLRIPRYGTNPAYWNIESGNGTENYMWWSNTGDLRVHTSAPTSATQGTAGSVIAGSANAGASRSLDNLGTTAVNADIIIDDDINLSLGDSSDVTMDWKSGGGMYWDFAAGDSDVNFGNTNPSALILHGASYDAGWDGADDSFQIMQDAELRIGDTAIKTQDDGITIIFDGTSLDLDAVNTGDGIWFGANVGTDVRFDSVTNANKDIHWDESAYTLRFLDTTILGFGTGGSTDYDLGFSCSTAPLLSLLQKVNGDGAFAIGVDDHGIDTTFYSDTSGDYMMWDADAANLASTALGALIFEDSFIRIAGGNNYDLAISTNELVLDATDAATAQFVFGTSGTHGLNVEFQSITALDLITFDAGAKTLTFRDIGAVFGYDDNTVAYTLQTLTGDKLVLTSTDTSAAELVLGVSTGTHGLDVTFQTASASDFIKFDAQGKTFTFTDVSPVMADNDLMLFGSATGGDISVSWENTGSTLDIECVSTGVGTVDFMELPVIMSAGDDNGVSLTVAGIDTTADANTVNITHSGSGFGLEIESLDVDSVQLGLLAEASQTHSMAIVDGQSVDWIGNADNTGMVSIIHGTTAIAHAGGTMLYVASDAVQKDSAEGTMARFLNTGAASSATGAVGVEIAVAATDIALSVTTGAVIMEDGFVGGSVARTATADGLTTGTILPGEGFIAGTASNAAHWFTLPTPVIGRVIWIATDTDACELRASGATVAINGGAGASAEMEILTTDYLTRCVCIGLTDPGWIVSHFAANGTESAGDVAA